MNNRICQIREEMNLSREEFANMLNVSRSYIWMIENGERTPSDRTISDICREFNINEEWLKTGKGEIYRKESPDAALTFLFAKLIGSDDDSDTARLKKAVIREILETDEAAWPYILEFVKNLAKSMEKKEEEQE